MQDARVRAALLVVCLVCLLGSGFVLVAGHRPAPSPVVITPPPEITTQASAPTAHAAPKPATRIYVDVAGAVRRPSLYVLSPESRVLQAILAAGGPASDADMDAVNLAQKVTDGEKVFVPKRMTSTPLRDTSSLPAVNSDTTPLTTPASSKAAKQEKGSRTGHSNKVTADSGEQISLNTATEEQLERLPGVGPGMAARILAYRQQAGGFGKIEDLMQVTGIGPKKYAKIAPCVKLN